MLVATQRGRYGTGYGCVLLAMDFGDLRTLEDY